ncbi:hypothetical protein HDU97_006554 [Phlyctochytrium planicorne]|nr:hypothetical protein HDU97_006554 [Phlyctochytrium planicorne]
MSLLIKTIGVSALAGFGLLLAMIPLQTLAVRKLVQLRKSNATTTDQRIKLTTEALTSIRVLKFFSWESSFLDRIMDVRSKELVIVITSSLLRSFVNAAGFAIPALAAALTFMVYYVVDPSLNPVKVFTALALFNQLRNPIMWTPVMIGAYADASVAVKRMTDLLLSAELDFHPETDPAGASAVIVKNGSFYWDTVPSSEIDGKEEASKLPPPTVSEESEEADDSRSVQSHATSTANALANTMAPFVSTGSMVGEDPVEHKAKQMDAEEAAMSTDLKAAEDITASHLFEKVDAENKSIDDVKETAPDASPAPRLAIKNINLTIPTGSLVAVVGAVGSGKTSFISALIGALKAHGDARVVFNGSVGYVPQQAWIMNATLRDNILFGLPFDQERYDRAIDVCALRKDLDVLAGGDMAEIGERGINLSGGQKQRVSLARLVYFNSSIVLLDDPLSAVDAHVGRHIFENCIQKELGKKTRILVTHQLHFVPQCDLVVTLKDGAIAECGTYNELIEAKVGRMICFKFSSTGKGEFATLMQNYGGISQSDDSDDSEGEGKADTRDDSSAEKSKSKESLQKEEKKGQLIQAEERMTGTLKNSVLFTLAIAMGGPVFMTFLVITLVMTQIARIVNDLWLVQWTSRSIPGVSGLGYLWGYLGFGLSQAVFLFTYCALVSIGGMKAARHLQSDALARIMRSPIVFFDTNPLGRIMNRMSRDVDIVDNTLPDAVRMFSLTFATGIATFGLILSARELKRMDSTTRSPVYALFSETFVGISTIRAYNVVDRFVTKIEDLIDTNNGCYYLQLTAQRWLGMRLEFIGNILVLSTSLFSVIQRDNVSAALSGLSLAYALQVTQLLSLCIRQYTEAEVQLVSVERLNHYAKNIDVEADEIIEDRRPPKEWPSNGEIAIKDLSMRYQESLPLVLKDVSLIVKPFEKIGVVGRTGSGKSSLMLALFRIVEAAGGSIMIDNIPIQKIGLRDLRSRLSIIPQDPLLFSGTVRSNLDPFSEHLDADLWDALERSSMKEAVAALDGGLDAEIQAGGENLSVGQRQLMCLARAMVRKPKLVVLDECTANVDLETDSLIQKSLRENLKDATILTIAHRLNTVIDYDRILVLDQGHVAAFDAPATLLSPGHENQIFASLVDETGPANAAVLRSMASAKASRPAQ